MEIHSGRRASVTSGEQVVRQPAAAPRLVVVSSSGATPAQDALGRVVGGVVAQVVDLLRSVQGGVLANRAQMKPPVADTRLVEGAAAVLSDLVEHTSIGGERPLAYDSKPKQAYGQATATTSSRAWVAEVRSAVAGLRRQLDSAAARGVTQADMASLADWEHKFSTLAFAQDESSSLDLSA
ncbi:MAG: hypothetical protein JSS65_00985 [Armatimonadetes bacterium]|nr:hypothetical protein [Armatimonadota bacterium]